MAIEKITLQHTITAASDMSAASQQFCIVELSAGGVSPCDAATDVVLGVLQNSPTRGQAAEIALAGICKVRVGSADVSVGNLLGTGTDGRAIALTSGTSTGYFPFGKVLSVDAADNDGALVSALIWSPLTRNG